MSKKKIIDAFKNPITCVPIILLVPFVWLAMYKLYEIVYSLLFPCVSKYGCVGSDIFPFVASWITGVAIVIYLIWYLTEND